MNTITIKPIESSVKTKPVNDPVYSRIISAAVINERFRNLLLNDPVKAVTNGYSGETFELNKEDRLILSSIRANSLSDFARELVRVCSV